MRFIHTADWHLGKTLKSQPLLDDQIYILNELLKLIDDTKPDAVVIAGDVYDRNIPPVDAVALFDETVYKIISRKIPVLCISGNHDSLARLNFGSRILARQNFFINASEPVALEDKFGEVYFALMPYRNSAEIKNIFAQDVDDANKFYVDEARKKIPAGKRSVAVAHLFVTGGVVSESEHKLVGGIGNVDAQIFSDFNYTALGHLHKPQTMKKTGFVVRYSGSLLKYSFDETGYSKGVTLVELDGTGAVTTEHIDLTPRRDVRIVEGTLANLRESEYTTDYIHANLTDKNYVLYAMDKLRNSAFPNILSLSFASLEREAENASNKAKRAADVSTLEYFADFFRHETGGDLSGDERIAMENFLAELENESYGRQRL
ncbi:MAG: exonuclease SbcCD subunit D [Selenomonadaceae bacterium]|nr:exonuclease SbcCD subunit D [Selenomonadaceae bacterium]